MTTIKEAVEGLEKLYACDSDGCRSYEFVDVEKFLGDLKTEWTAEAQAQDDLLALLERLDEHNRAPGGRTSWGMAAARIRELQSVVTVRDATIERMQTALEFISNRRYDDREHSSKPSASLVAAGALKDDSARAFAERVRLLEECYAAAIMVSATGNLGPWEKLRAALKSLAALDAKEK